MYAHSLRQKHVSMVKPVPSSDPTFKGEAAVRVRPVAEAPVPESDREKLDLTSFPFLVELGEKIESTKEIRIQEELTKMEEIREFIADSKKPTRK